MGADQPEESDVPPDGHADRRDDQADGGARAPRSGGTPAETRSLEEYYADLRTAESAEKSVVARRTAAEEQAAAVKWDKAAEESRWMWGEYQRRWPPEERPHVDKSEKALDLADDSRVEAACDRIAELEDKKITPAMRALESQDPDRHLVGLKHRLKGRDRIKEKIADSMEEKNRTLEEALSLVPDTIRYTLQYERTRYTQGVWADLVRMKDHGFKLVRLKNSWEDEQYKGINSQWIEPDTGQRFEVQFHTRIRFEAKQLTHKAYERLRVQPPGKPDALEKMVLKAFQGQVSAEIPVPPGAADIPDYP